MAYNFNNLDGLMNDYVKKVKNINNLSGFKQDIPVSVIEDISSRAENNDYAEALEFMGMVLADIVGDLTPDEIAQQILDYEEQNRVD